MINCCVSLKSLILLLFSLTSGVFSEVKEYCQWETFEAKCSRNELVLIEEAKYGRMKIGKCIPQREVVGVLRQDPQYLGCFKDVTEILHRKCSFKNECQVSIPSADLDLTNPCFSELKSYLEADYKCIDAVESDENCRITVTQRPKYLVSTYKGQCGPRTRPWIVEATRGQRIKITFITLNKTTNFIDSPRCHYDIGSVTENDGISRRNISICSDGFLVESFSINVHKKENEILSRSSLIQIFVTSKSSDLQVLDKMFLIGLEADGCSDIIPPEDTWLKRNGDEIVIGCYSSKQTWYLRCENRKWTGVVGNCSIEIDAVMTINDGIPVQVKEVTSVSEEQQIILFVAICALGVVICLIIVCVGAICIKRYSWKSGAANIYNKQPAYYPSGQYSINRQTLLDKQQKFLTNFHEPSVVEGDSNHLPNGYNASDRSEENKYFVLEADVPRQ